MYHFKRNILLNVLNVQIATIYGEIICTDMKRLWGFAVSHIVTHYYATSHRVSWSVGLSVALSVCHTSESWKRLKRSSCHLRSGLGWAQWTTYYMTSRGQHGKGQFWVGTRQTIVKHKDTSQSSVQTRLNRSIWRFGCGLEWAEGCSSSIVFARWHQCALIGGGHVAVTCRITLNHPSTAAMRHMSNYFDHTLSLDTPT